jgi:hypothetical protein
VEGQIKPGSELAVLHEGNPDPFLPPIGSEPVLLRPGREFINDQISQAVGGSRSTNNNFTAVLKGGLDDDRLGIDSLQRLTPSSPDIAAGQVGSVDGGPGVDTLFFSTQRSNSSDTGINLVGLGSRIRNIEAIEIPINNTLILDEALLLNTPLHRLKLESRGAAQVTLHTRSIYEYIGDQMDAGKSYSVFTKSASNLQLWLEQGRVSMNQTLNNVGSSASIKLSNMEGRLALSSEDPIDSDGLAADPSYAYRWYRDGDLIVGASEATYGAEVQQALSPGSYVRVTDYTDRHGLRDSVTSEPIVIDPARSVAGGTLWIGRTKLDKGQKARLGTSATGWQPSTDLLLANFTAGEATEAGVHRLNLPTSSSNSTHVGLVAMVNGDGQNLLKSQAGLTDSTEPSPYDLNGDGRIDSLIWQPDVNSGSLDTVLLTTDSPTALVGKANGLLRFTQQRRSSIAGVQSVSVSLLKAPRTMVSIIGIPLGEGESLKALTAGERSARALTLLSSASRNTQWPHSTHDRRRSFGLRTDQKLALLELRGTSPENWDGTSNWRSVTLRPSSMEKSQSSELKFRSPSGLRFRMSSETTPQNIDDLVARTQIGGTPVLDFRGLHDLKVSGTTRLHNNVNSRTRIGFYPVETLEGEIRDPLTNQLVAPGDPNYGSIAKEIRTKKLDYHNNTSSGTSSRPIKLASDQLLAPFVITNNELHGKNAYFAFQAANQNELNHFTSLGTNTIGFEKHPFGRGRSFTDLIFDLQLEATDS